MGLVVAALTGLVAFGIVGNGWSQTLGEMNTAMNMQDTLSGGGYTPSTYIAPRRLGPMGGPPAYPAPPNAMAPGPFGSAAAPVEPVAPAPPPINKILVLTGERVACRVLGTLLEDIHYEYRPEGEKKEYYDDGMRGNDLVANDNIYTNWTERNDVLSPEANRLKLVYLRMFQIVEETHPIEFFRIPVAIEEPLSRLPKVSDEEKDRDETFLRRWHQQFLALYRQDQEDPLSDFFPIFVPSPPRPPDVPAPPGDEFSPNAYALDDYIQRTVEGVAGVAAGPEAAAGGAYWEAGTYYDDRTAYGDRWSQLRQDARRSSMNASSRYMRD